MILETAITSTLVQGLPFTHLSQRDVDTLSKLARQVRDGGVVVEIGSYLGASSICLARNLRPNCRLFCIDTWTNIGMSEGQRDTFAEFLRNTEQLRGVICPVRADSREAASRFNKTVDFLFIDGDHSHQGCQDDLFVWLPKIKEGGVVALRDFAWADGVREGIRDHLFPVQDGQGHWEGNVYWTRIGQSSAPTASTSPRATIIVSTYRGDYFKPEWMSNVGPSSAKNLQIVLVYTGQTKIPPEEERETGSVQSMRVSESVPGLLAGRHKGFEVAQNEILIYVDDDVWLPAGWLEAILEPFQDPTVHLVGCRYLPKYESAPPNWLSAFWAENSHGRHLGYLSLADYGHGTEPIDPVMIWGLCYAIRRETLFKLGGFHPDAYAWPLRRYRGDGESAPSQFARQLKLKAIYQGKTAAYHEIPTSRLSADYLIRRSYLQGISDSYSNIREAGGLTDASTSDTYTADKLGLLIDFCHRIPRKSPRQMAEALSRRATRLRTSLSNRLGRIANSPIATIRHQIDTAYATGYAFHRDAVMQDPTLLDWVLRQSYWDYRLPKDWEQYYHQSA